MRDVVAAFRDLEPNAAITLSRTSAPAGPEVLDNSRAVRDLEFKPMTSMAEGLRLYRNALAGQGGI